MTSHGMRECLGAYSALLTASSCCMLWEVAMLALRVPLTESRSAPRAQPSSRMLQTWTLQLALPCSLRHTAMCLRTQAAPVMLRVVPHMHSQVQATRNAMSLAS